MKFLNYRKGQGIVEFAMVLAFVAAIGLFARDGGLQDAIVQLFEPAAKILRAVDHHSTYDVAESVEKIKSIQKNGNYSYNNTSNGIHYNRGMIRSGWVDKTAGTAKDDTQITEIKNLYDELGATQWSYLNGLGNNYKSTPSNKGLYTGDVGIYWTVEVLSQHTITANGIKEKENYSKELVLQYFYSSVTKKYYVIKSYVWINQGDVDNRIALGGLHQHWEKPAGYFVEGCVDGFDTFAEAKELFERARRENGYSVIFDLSDVENNGSDVSAANYLINSSGNKFVYTE